MHQKMLIQIHGRPIPINQKNNKCKIYKDIKNNKLNLQYKNNKFNLKYKNTKFNLKYKNNKLNLK